MNYVFTAILMITLDAVAEECPIEVGAVQWSRDLDAALKKSTETRMELPGRQVSQW